MCVLSFNSVGDRPTDRHVGPPGVHGNAHTVFVFHLAIDEDPHGDGREPLSGSPASPVERRVRSKITFVDCASSNGFKERVLNRACNIDITCGGKSWGL